MQRPFTLLFIAGSVFSFCLFGATHSAADNGQMNSSREDYNEECLQEGCDGEEVSELYESYESECREETCDVEEVREMAGTRGAINAMLNDFRNRGWAVSNCSFVGPCNYAPGDNVASGDTTFGAFCTQSSINQHWDDFDFDKGDWDDGFGYDDPLQYQSAAGADVQRPQLSGFLRHLETGRQQ
ncbi:MAG: hypothetical protein ACREEM_19140 [Blastocatellia bacterium]